MDHARADRWLLYCMSAFFLMTGASLWETAVFVPVWASGNSATLITLGSRTGIDSAFLWVSVHSLFEVISLLTLVFNWRLQSRRNALLVIFALYAVIRLWTIVYFAPSFLKFQKLASDPTLTTTLIEATIRWKRLNYVRTVLVTLLNIFTLMRFSRMLSSARKSSDEHPA
jgi:hypothetical protein